MRYFLFFAFTLLFPILCIADPTESASRTVDPAFGSLPLYFIENQGQIQGEAAYYVKGNDKTVSFTTGGIDFSLTGPEQPCNVQLDFVGARRDAEPVGKDRQEAIFSFFRGSPENWKKGIPSFSGIEYSDLWPGIDLAYSGTVNRLKYEFRVEPGADPSAIRLTYRGVTGLRVNHTGGLEVSTPVAAFEDGVPFAYQEIEGQRREVAMRYLLHDSEEEGGYSYGFELGAYDTGHALVMDPAILVYCGFIGGSDDEYGIKIDIDDAGCAYAFCEIGTYPWDVFVAKVNAQGTGLVYLITFGGSGEEASCGIAVDSNGCAYVTGATESTDFPVVGGPDLTYNGGGFDAYVARVNAQGTGFDYSGFIGGSQFDWGSEVAVDGNGNAYVTGRTESDQNTFPVAGGPDLYFNGLCDGFVARVNIQGTGLDYCGYIGGSGEDGGEGITVDQDGRAYITGWTSSSTFPVVVGPDLTHNGGFDAFVARVNVQGTALERCGYVGGANDDEAYGIDLGTLERCYISGFTSSPESSFPVGEGPDLTYNGGDADGFAARVNAQWDGLDFCGYIGGDGEDIISGIGVDDADNSYVSGFTESTESSFPVSGDIDDTYNGGSMDAFVARINDTGTDLDYCGYIGGSNMDEANGIVVSGAGDAYIIGQTSSTEFTFPELTGPDLTFGGYVDAFVAKISFKTLMTDTDTLPASSGSVVNFFLDATSKNANRHYFMLGSVTGTSPGTPLPGGLVVLPLNWDVFTNIVFALANTPVFSNFHGVLDANGTATAKLDATGLIPPAAIGAHLYFAYLVYTPGLLVPYDFVSNSVDIEVVN